MIIIKRSTFFVPLLTLFLTACSIIFPKEKIKDIESPRWFQHQQELHNLNHYQAHGVIIYSFCHKKVYIRFFLQKAGHEYYRLLLNNILGEIQLEINMKYGILKLLDKEGHFFIIKDSKIIMKKLINIPISFNNLFQWIIGLPGEATNYKFDDQYRLSEINYIDNDQSLKIIYENYDNRTKPSLPSNISIKFKKNNQFFKMKIDTWVIK